MKKLYLLCWLILLNCLSASAQYFQWAKAQSAITNGPVLAAGNNFIAATGQFHRSITFGSQTLTSPDTLNAYLAAYDLGGNPLWAKHIISNSYFQHHVTVDQNNNIILAGTFQDSLYIGSLLFKGTTPNSQGVFVAKYNAAGTLLWAQSSAITTTTQPRGISVSADANGNVYLSGIFGGNISFGSNTFSSPNSYAFLAKYDSNGLLQWAKVPYPNLYVSDVKAKATGSSHLYFAVSTDSAGLRVSKLNGSGTMAWEAFVSGINRLNIRFDIATDNAGHAYISGSGGSPIIFSNMIGAYTISNGTMANNRPVFIAKLTQTGNWTWKNWLATGSYTAEGPAIFYNENNNRITVSGAYTGAASFNNTNPIPSVPATTFNSFAVNLDTAGTHNWTNVVNGTNFNSNSGLTGDANGNLYIAGLFHRGAINFNTHVLNSTSVQTGYLAKLSSDINQVSGTVFVDANGNGTKDSNELPFPNLILETSPAPAIQYATSNNGDYRFYLPAGTFSLNVPNTPRHHTLAPASQSVTFSGLNQTQTGKDFALQPIPNRQDVSVTVTNLTPARPGFTLKYRLTFRNIGTTPQSDSISLNFNAAALSFASSTVVPAVQQAGNLKWFYQNLQPYEKREIDITMNVATTAVLGANLQTLATIKPFTGDLFVQDNRDTLNFPVTGSYDPNDKQVNNQTLTPAQVAGGRLLDYTIRFQNTGTDTAFTVVVIDSISDKLQMPTFELLSASHPYTFRLLENGMGEWRFDNILLPDSNRNEPASHGFIRYRIQPKNNLVLGDEIRSRAAIYFDYNAPVMTNYAITRVANPTGIKEAKAGLQAFSLYPNPARNYVMVAAAYKKKTVSTVSLVNLLGQTLHKVTLPANDQIHFQMPLNNLPKGVYVVQLETEIGRQTQRLVIQ
ncbi:DUF7619 domain-containing protein [Adhaeribacter soli]|uniref:T9SS type A sorting domain-containing protein n=1 Tax=Adhaeribacter soli TaxID=2607655 RepID=A0A5N1J6P6_9BACT|nr:T9SS type A sorting domain-containing protein [Adhaeribacter soli]KAA9340867.1 T9SS type A sorting domain-containing protein [Adhaeribacter soli]